LVLYDEEESIMALFLDCVTLDCADPQRLAAFWVAAFHATTTEEKDDWVVVQLAEGGRPVVGFQRVPEPKTVKNRVHLDVRMSGGVTLEEEKARLLNLGAHAIRLIGDEPGNTHWIMQDPEGNEFCLVEP
jgi:predicted enzyme related to lactoylglutathione lyase